jgi:hypothetical protein
MFFEGWVIDGEGCADCLSLFSGRGDKRADILFIEEQVIAVNNRLFTPHRQVLTGPQFKLPRRIRGKHISLMQPQGLILDTQIPSKLIEWRNKMGGRKDHFEHIKKLLFHKIEKTGRKVPAL